MNKKFMSITISLLITSFKIFGCTSEPSESEKAYARSLRADAAMIDFATAARAAAKVQEDTDRLRAVEKSYHNLEAFILSMQLRGPQTTTDIIIPRSELLGFAGLQDEKRPETFQERIAHSDASAKADLRARKITFVDPAFRKVARDNPQEPMEQFRLVAYAAARRAAFKKHLDVMQKIVAIDPENIRLIHAKLSDDGIICGVFIKIVDDNGACAEIVLEDYFLEGGHIKNPKLYTMPGLRYWSNPLARQASAAQSGAQDKRCILQ